MKTLVCLGLTLGLGAAIADAAIVCVRKNNRLVLRATCRAGERPFDPSGFTVDGPAGPPGPQGPAGDPGTFPLRLVDANEQEIGEIHELTPGNAWVEIVRPPIAEPVLFFVAAKGFLARVGSPTLRYVNADCAGVPYIEQAPVHGTRADVYGSAAYYSTSLPVDVETQSVEIDYGGPCPTDSTPTTRSTCCHNSTGMSESYKPAVRVDIVSLGLRPPFRAVRSQEESQ